MLLSHFILQAVVLSLVGQVSAQLHPKDAATYPSLPCLREQADILNKWTAERLSHIPELMRKYAVGAWLVRIQGSSVVKILANCVCVVFQMSREQI